MKYLIYGGKGWIGQQVCQCLNTYPDANIIYGLARADDEVAVEKEINEHHPDRIISLIGRTYGPGFSTIDYLEQKGKLVENVRDNLYAPLVLSLLAKQYNIHLTYLGTGCIFNGHGENDNGYVESDKPDFFGSAYSTVKGFTDRIMHFMDDTVLNVRIRMPISNEVNPRNFITKIMNYKKICSIPNSMTVLPELIPVMIEMMHNKETGTINLTNPGLITHNEILEMVKEIVDPEFTWENFTLEEQRKVLLADRSNNFLNTDKLEKLYPNVLPIKESVRNVLLEMKKTYKNIH
jgi:dTDP-4-dehydrorhamnose reductase